MSQKTIELKYTAPIYIQVPQKSVEEIINVLRELKHTPPTGTHTNFMVYLRENILRKGR